MLDLLYAKRLRPATPPPCASDGARVYVLLPTLEELVGRPGFGSRDAIYTSPARRLAAGWPAFHRARPVRRTWH